MWHIAFRMATELPMGGLFTLPATWAACTCELVRCCVAANVLLVSVAMPVVVLVVVPAAVRVALAWCQWQQQCACTHIIEATTPIACPVAGSFDASSPCALLPGLLCLLLSLLKPQGGR